MTCTTTSTGRCSVSSSQLDRKSSAGITASVGLLTLNGYSYVAASNHDSDGGTNGTSITLTRP
jgi:hypothetical protein